MDRLFVIGDLHFSQTSNKPMDIFGKAWENHTERLVENWRAVVDDGDVVVVNGDISWGMKLEEAAADLVLLDSLPGTKIIMKGNHELWWTSLAKIRDVFRSNGIKTIRPLYNNAYIWPEKHVLIFGTRGWCLPGDDNYREVDAKIVRREMVRFQASYDHAKRLEEKYIEYVSGASEVRRFDESEVIGPDIAEVCGEYETLAFMHYPPFVFSKRESTVFTDFCENNSIRRCFFGHVHGAGRVRTEGGEILPVYKNEGVSYYLTAADFFEMRPGEIKV